MIQVVKSDEDFELETSCGTRTLSIQSTWSECNENNFSDSPQEINLSKEAEEAELILASLLADTLKERGEEADTDTLTQVKRKKLDDDEKEKNLQLYPSSEVLYLKKEKEKGGGRDYKYQPQKRTRLMSPNYRKKINNTESVDKDKVNPKKVNKKKQQFMDKYLCGPTVSLKNKDRTPSIKDWNKSKEEALRRQSRTERTLNGSVSKLFEASGYWSLWDSKTVSNQVANSSVPDDGSMAESIQDFDKKPVFFGADVCTLYPSLDILGTADLASRSVLESNVRFEGINVKMLAIYLFLVLGRRTMHKLGLGKIIPQRMNNKSQAVSLNASSNRDSMEWSMCEDSVTEKVLKAMLAALVKVLTIVLMKSTCYTFGGVIFKQLLGAGIGLRASACLAKLIMGQLDKRWAYIQLSWGLLCLIYLRYVDDMRVFMHPIRRGWTWSDQGWKYDADNGDTRDDIRRTTEEIDKSLNSLIDFLSFTTESELDFGDDGGFLPTLDFKTKVQDDGVIEFKFFSKPMNNNLVIQKGTGLPKEIIFASLRQEVIRRMLNCSTRTELDERLLVLEDFIQLLVNSGHNYAFIKAIMLQGLTKYKCMVLRSELEEENKKFRPLYRNKRYKEDERTIIKYLEASTWFTGEKLGDPYKNEWKKRIVRRGVGEDKNSRVGDSREISTVFFVPPSRDSKLLNLVREVEKLRCGDLSWRVKIVISNCPSDDESPY